jgi:hypothetical protein
MKHAGKFGVVLLALASATGMALASDVDWKMYGFASLEGAEICFYEANSVAHPADGHVRVWTKCLSQKEMDDIDIKHDFGGQILENAAQKVAQYYLPPFTEVEKIDVDQAITITQYEETANIAYIQPHAKIYYDLDCSQKMLRELSVDISAKGKRGGTDKPSAWRYIPPEGNGANLLKILCPMQ